jgi:hypothetical protein
MRKKIVVLLLCLSMYTTPSFAIMKMSAMNVVECLTTWTLFHATLFTMLDFDIND